MTSRRRVIHGLVAHVAALAMLAGSAEAARKAAAPRDPAALEVTRLRAAQGLGPVRGDPALARAARQQADAMARQARMSHDVAGSLSTRLAAAGVRARSAAENVAAGQHSLSEVMADWMNSSGHRANLLMREATRVGLARAEGSGGPYWALLLAADEPAPDAAGSAPGGTGFFFGVPLGGRP